VPAVTLRAALLRCSSATVTARSDTSHDFSAAGCRPGGLGQRTRAVAGAQTRRCRDRLAARWAAAQSAPRVGLRPGHTPPCPKTVAHAQRLDNQWTEGKAPAGSQAVESC